MRILRIVLLLVLLGLALVFPVLLSPNLAVTSVAIFTLIFAIAVTGWNMFSGYTGYISLGHAVYFGLGAYTIALGCQQFNIPGGYPPFLLLPLAGLVAGIFAIPLGWLALRVRRYVFIVVTIAFLFIFQLLAYNLKGITNGSAGVFLPLTSWSSDFFDLPFYYIALALLTLSILVSWRIRHSKYGLGLLSIRDDEDRALGLGVKTGAFKLGVYVISAIFVGMAGALYTYYVGITFPQFAFDPAVDVNLTLMAFLGGLGTLAGPILGAVLTEPLQQYLTLQFGVNSLSLVLFGGLLLLVLLFLPRGIVPSLQDWWRSLRVFKQARLKSAPATKQERTALVKKGEG